MTDTPETTTDATPEFLPETEEETKATWATPLAFLVPVAPIVAFSGLSPWWLCGSSPPSSP